MTKYEVEILKRNEHITDVIMQLKSPIMNMIMDLWTRVHKDENIPKTKWLSQFQLSLKTIKSMGDELIITYLRHKKRLLTSLHSALMLTAYIHHNEASPNIVKEEVLVIKFTRDCALQAARELWSKPYIVYNITHKKNQVQSARDELENIVASSIKYEIRQLVDNVMIIETERLKQCQDLIASVASSSVDEDSESIISSLSSDTIHTQAPSQPTDNIHRLQSNFSSTYKVDDDSMSIKSINLRHENNSYDTGVLSGNQSPRSTISPLDMDYIPRKEPSFIASPRISESFASENEKTLDIADAKTSNNVDTTSVDGSSRMLPIVIEKSNKKKKKKFLSALDRYSEYRTHHSLAASSLIGQKPKHEKKATFF